MGFIRLLVALGLSVLTGAFFNKGEIGSALLSLVCAVIATLVFGLMIDWRHETYWYQLRPGGLYYVLKIVPSDSGRIALFLEYTEGDKTGYSIYECSRERVPRAIEEGDQILVSDSGESLKIVKESQDD